MSKSICKFTPTGLTHSLVVHCFVLETDKEIMDRGHDLACTRMTLAVKGEGTLSANNYRYDFGTGKLFFSFPGEHFCVNANEGATYMYIDFSGQRGEELMRRFNISKANRYFENFDALIPIWGESLSRASGQTTDLAAESMILYTFSRMAGAFDTENSLLGRMIEITDENFKDTEFSLSELANILSYNPKYVSHLFKKKMNVSFSEYLTSLRVKYAVTLFDFGLDSVKNVALLSGFGDPLYFSKIFKKKLGVSPKEYLMGKTRGETSDLK